MQTLKKCVLFFSCVFQIIIHNNKQNYERKVANPLPLAADKQRQRLIVVEGPPTPTEGQYVQIGTQQSRAPPLLQKAQHH